MANLNYIKYKFLKPFKSWKNKYLKSLAKKDALRRDLYNQAAKEISEYTGEPIEAVKHKHNLGPESEKLFSIFKERAKAPKESVEDFYKACSYYLYELPLWNAERNRPKYLSLICLFNFAQWRFAKRNLPIKMVNGLDNLRAEGFDCILSFDAFEHIKDLPAVVKKLSACLKESVSLIFTRGLHNFIDNRFFKDIIISTRKGKHNGKITDCR